MYHWGFVFIHNTNLSDCDICEELLHLSYSRSCKLKNNFICVIKRNLEKVVFDKAMWAAQNMNLYLKLKNHQNKQSLNANNIFSNLKVRVNSKLIIGNLNLNSVSGKFDQRKLMVQYKTYLPYLFLSNLYETQKPSMWNCWFRKREPIFVSVELVCHTSSTETKIDSSFLNQQFHIKGFCLPYRLDRNKYGG